MIPLVPMRRTLVLFSALVLPTPGTGQQEQAAGSWTLTGTVVDAEGHPIEGAGMVFGSWQDVLTEDALDHPRARSGPDGRFRLPLEGWDPGSQRIGSSGLLIAAPGRASVAIHHPALLLRPLHPNAKCEVIELGEVMLPPGLEVFGRVRDPEGRPIGGVLVTTRDVLADYGMPELRGGVQLTSSARTGEDGIFRLRGVPSFGLRLELRCDGYYRRTILPVAHGTPLQIEMRPSGFVSGRVLGPDGEAVKAGVAVQYRAIGIVPGNPWQVLPQPGYCETDGTFRLGLELPGPFRMLAVAPQGLGVCSLATDWMTEPAAEVELRLEPPLARPGLLVEAVARRSGEAVGDVRAGVMWDGFPQYGLSYLPFVLGYIGHQAEAGSVIVPCPGVGEADRGALFVDAPGYAPFFEKVIWTGPRDTSRDRPRRHRVALEDPCLVKGRVVAAGTGEPIGGVEVWATPQDDSFFDSYTDSAWRMLRSVTTDTDGAFKLAGLAPGNWAVRAQVPGRPGRVAKEVELHREDVVEGFDLEMPPGRTVELVLPGVVGGRGIEIEVIRNEVGEQPFEIGMALDPGFGCRVPVDAEGRARVPGLASGRWSLRLLIPQLEGRISPLALPLGDFEVADDADKVTVDLADSLPATVSGELRIEGADAPRHRFLVVANLPSMSFHAMAVGGVSPVAADGSFRLIAPAGDSRLFVIDLGTGATVAAGEALALEPGSHERQHLTADLVELTVEIEDAAAGGRGAWPDHVEMHVELEGVRGADFLPDGYPSGIGRSVAEGEREVTLFVPRGLATVTLRGVNERAAGPFPSTQLYEVLDRQEIQVDTLEPLRVILRAGAGR